MTPLEIEILLHYHCCGNDYRDGDFSSPAVREAIEHFEAIGLLIDYAGSRSEQRYKPSDGVALYAKALQAVPLPVKKWVMP